MCVKSYMVYLRQVHIYIYELFVRERTRQSVRKSRNARVPDYMVMIVRNDNVRAMAMMIMLTIVCLCRVDNIHIRTMMTIR